MRSAAVAQQQAGSSSFLILEIDLNYFIFTARSRLARPSCPFYDRALIRPGVTAGSVLAQGGDVFRKVPGTPSCGRPKF